MIDIHAHALEKFNRATHENALREMQIVTAEELQADDEPETSITLRFAIGLALFVTPAIGAHAAWAASGMPTL